MPRVVSTMALALTSLLCLLTVAVAVPGGSQALAGGSTVTDDELRLRFDLGRKKAGDELFGFANSGVAPVTTSVVSDAGGAVVRVTGMAPWAIRFPAYVDAGLAPRAVIAVRSTTATDQLEPRASTFRFGADIRLNVVSAGRPTDNGDNVIQRGLVDQLSQFKIQVDGRFPVCVVRGTDGAARVEATDQIRPGAWYRVDCLRSGDEVRLSVREYLDPGWSAPVVTSLNTPTGDLDFDAGNPLSIGGKLSPDGSLAPESDQLNGGVDNAFFRIG